MYSYTMHEALARERVRERHEWSRRSLLHAELATVRRWHRLELRARAAQRRHSRLAAHHASAVAEVAGEGSCA